MDVSILKTKNNTGLTKRLRLLRLYFVTSIASVILKILCNKPRISIMLIQLKQNLCILAFTFMFLVFVPQIAFAYLDPGTGSYLFQVIVLSIMGFFFTLRMYWQRFLAFLKSLFGKKESDVDG